MTRREAHETARSTLDDFGGVRYVIVSEKWVNRYTNGERVWRQVVRAVADMLYAECRRARQEARAAKGARRIVAQATGKRGTA